MGALNESGVGKIHIFQPISHRISETVQNICSVQSVSGYDLDMVKVRDVCVLQVFVECSGSELEAVDFTKTQLYQLLDRFDNTIRIRIYLPSLNGLLI